MGNTAFLLVLLIVACAIGMAIFCMLWLRGRETRLQAEHAADMAAKSLREAEANVTQLEARARKATDALLALRNSSAEDREKAEAIIERWSARYQRLAHWEGVQDFADRERGLRETVAVLERAVEALRNVIEGYGSRYVVPPRTILDELAAEAAHTPPGQRLREARERTRRLAKDRRAATSDEPDSARGRLAADFATDAFNGKVDAILGSVKSDNIGTLLQKLDDAFTLVNEQGAAIRNVRITPEYKEARISELKWAAKVQQLKQEEREQQRLVKERMREEAKVQKELERAQAEARKREDALVRERSLIEEARSRIEREQREIYESRLREELAKAGESERARIETELRGRMEEQQAATKAEYEARLAETDARLADALAARERAKSMAQQTKRGTVYVISNVGAFGETVFKIGQTRRLDPMDRIWELGDASVPFDFDVHALITTDDAPGLESLLHEHFVLSQVNKMNWRKEFFRVDLTKIRTVVEDMGLQAAWTMTAAAQQFRETQALERQLDSDPAFRDRWVQEQRGVEFEATDTALVADDRDEE